jgi:hypothetical protein
MEFWKRDERNQRMKKLMTSMYFAFGVIAFVCFAVSPVVQAVVPPPDGGYPNFTTAEGDNALKHLTSGLGNTGIGTFSLFSVSTGNFNTAVGAGALDLNLGSSNTATGTAALLFNTTGSENTANGTAALEFNDTGSNNTAVGASALFTNTEGFDNTAHGAASLLENTTGHDNTGAGFSALRFNTTGFNNTGVGSGALEGNSPGLTGSNNTAAGANALTLNTSGDNNTANGSGALFSNVEGNNNTSGGAASMLSNTGGNDNTANGFSALRFNTTGSGNTGFGSGALEGNAPGITGAFNTALGFNALNLNTTGNGNTALGSQAGLQQDGGSGNVYIGAGVDGTVGENDHTYIRNINTTSVSGGGTDTVTINLTTGLLGHATSSRRYKENIAPMDKASEALYRLNPVTYRYKKDIDPTQSPAFGLIAEEVAKVNPDLVTRNAKGEPESVHYEHVNAMLLNEFLKEHQAFVEEQRKVETLEKQVAALTAGLQKVSMQLDPRQPAPRNVSN